jgi:chromate transport protein ChrA
VKGLLLALIATAVLLLASYFLLIVVSYAYAATRPLPSVYTPFLAPLKPLPCVACVSLMAPVDRKPSLH